MKRIKNLYKSFLREGTVLTTKETNEEYIVVSRLSNHHAKRRKEYITLCINHKSDTYFNLSAPMMKIVICGDARYSMIPNVNKRKLAHDTVSKITDNYTDVYLTNYALHIALNSKYSLYIPYNARTISIVKNYNPQLEIGLNLLDYHEIIDIILQVIYNIISIYRFVNCEHILDESFYTESTENLINFYIKNYSIYYGDISLKFFGNISFKKLMDISKKFPNEFQDVIHAKRWQRKIDERKDLKEMIEKIIKS